MFDEILNSTTDYSFWKSCLEKYEQIRDSLLSYNRFELAYFLAINAGMYADARHMLDYQRLSELERYSYMIHLPSEFVDRKIMFEDHDEYVISIPFGTVPQVFLDSLHEKTLVLFGNTTMVALSCDECGNMHLSPDFELQEEQHVCNDCEISLDKE